MLASHPSLQRVESIPLRCLNQASTSYSSLFVSKNVQTRHGLPELVRDNTRGRAQLCRSSDSRDGRSNTVKETSRMTSSSSHRKEKVTSFILGNGQVAGCNNNKYPLNNNILLTNLGILDKQDSSLDRDVNPMPYGLITVLASAGALETAYLTLVRENFLSAVIVQPEWAMGSIYLVCAPSIILSFLPCSQSC